MIPRSPATTPDSDPAPRAVGYYGLPVIHGPHWKWLIVGYFFLGGISGSAAAIGAFARLFGDMPGATIGRRATYVSLLSLLPCPILLILDLGRPRRFINMLLAFRPSSPMSMGTWALTGFSVATSATALLHIAADRSHRPHAWLRHVTTSASTASGLLGFVVAGYTGVLLAATAVPLWSKRPQLLGPLFLASAMSSGAAAIAITSPLRTDAETAADDALHRFEVLATAAEGILLVSWISALGSTARPLSEKPLAPVVRLGVVGLGMVAAPIIAAGAARLPWPVRRAALFFSAALTLSGAFALRYAVVEGGRRSADDPVATFDLYGSHPSH